MSYQPNKKELKQIQNINKSYAEIKKNLQLLKDNIPKDNEIWTRAWRIQKEVDRITKRVIKVLEKQYVDKEFINIIDTSKKNKGKRFKKNNKVKNKRKSKKRGKKK